MTFARNLDASILDDASSLKADARGANLVEYIVIVGVVALFAVFGFRSFATTISRKGIQEGGCVAEIERGGCTNAGAATSTLADARFTRERPVDTSASYKRLHDVNLAGVRYVPIEGMPFSRAVGDSTDVAPSDIDQGNIGDCYVMSTLAEAALRHPEIVRNAVEDNGDGTYTVTLYEKAPWYKFWERGYHPVPVIVTPDFPSKDGVHPFFAGLGNRSAGVPELWPALIEKAYAQENGGYDRIGNGGAAAAVMAALTGKSSTRFTGGWFGGNPTFNDIADRWDRGDLVTVGTKHDGDGPLFKKNVLVTGHAYYVTSVDRANHTITVRNPWGWDAHGSPTTISFDDFKRHFDEMSSNPGISKPR